MEVDTAPPEDTFLGDTDPRSRPALRSEPRRYCAGQETCQLPSGPPQGRHGPDADLPRQKGNVAPWTENLVCRGAAASVAPRKAPCGSVQASLGYPFKGANRRIIRPNEKKPQRPELPGLGADLRVGVGV
jgi:hypothetical protein